MQEQNGPAYAYDAVDVGKRIRSLRRNRDLSLRALAELSGLNVNTLSLIENGRTSPSVSTLQQLAQGLQIRITTLFETSRGSKEVVYQKSANRPRHAPLWGRADYCHAARER
jgi:transcriptional regulator with XRE-family HTH domain